MKRIEDFKDQKLTSNQSQSIYGAERVETCHGAYSDHFEDTNGNCVPDCGEQLILHENA